MALSIRFEVMDRTFRVPRYKATRIWIAIVSSVLHGQNPFSVILTNRISKKQKTIEVGKDIGSILRNKVKVMSGSDRDRSSSHRHRSRSRSRSKFELVC